MIYSLVSGPATLSGPNNNTVTVTGAGTVMIAANQGGNGTYKAAASVTRSFVVSKGTAVVTLGALSTTYTGSAQGASVMTTPNGLSVTLKV